MRVYDIINAGDKHRFALGDGSIVSNCGRLLQMQNLSHDTIDDLDAARVLAKIGDYDDFKAVYPNVQYVLKCLIRTLLIPEKDSRFIVADFSAIEARVLAWLAGEQWRLKTFEENGDIYCASASQAFKVPVVKHGINGHLRQKGKVLELACGYSGGVGAMKNFGADKLGMTEEEMAETVAKWREASPNIVKLWSNLEKSAIKCLKTKSHQIVPCPQPVCFDYENGILFMTLPSKRRIAYYGAEIGENKWGRPSILYWTIDMSHKWKKTETYSGKLTENLTQSAARDVLAEAMFHLADAGYDIRGHVHDEIIMTSPNGHGSLEEAIGLMCKGSSWTKGLPLNADGFENEISYRKD